MRTFIIADLHGCFDELQLLLNKISYDPAKYSLVFLGDLLDRGPKSLDCVRFVRALCENGNARCVLGNHEDSHVRFKKHQLLQNAKGIPNPMRFSKHKFELNEALSEQDVDWMNSLPLTIHIKENIYALHGGVEPAYSFNRQRKNQIIRCRYVSDGQHQTGSGKIIPRGVGLPMKEYKEPPHSAHWTEFWDGPESIIFGHYVNSLKSPLIVEKPNGVKCMGLDTGCVFGGMLTGYIVEDNAIVQVKSNKEYYHIEANFDDM